jgi:predicted DNA-binding ribbon-helix-helix protein
MSRANETTLAPLEAGQSIGADPDLQEETASAVGAGAAPPARTAAQPAGRADTVRAAGAVTMIPKRWVKVVRKKTCVTLEDPFWEALKEIAAARGINRNDLINVVAREATCRRRCASWCWTVIRSAAPRPQMAI